MRKLPNRCYFVVYESIYSFKISDAYEVAINAVKTGDYDLNKQGKLLKRKVNIEDQGKSLVFYVLDNTRNDWREIVDRLFNITKEKAIL